MPRRWRTLKASVVVASTPPLLSRQIIPRTPPAAPACPAARAAPQARSRRRPADRSRRRSPLYPHCARWAPKVRDALGALFGNSTREPLETGTPEARGSNEFYKQLKRLTRTPSGFVGRDVGRFFRAKRMLRTRYGRANSRLIRTRYRQFIGRQSPLRGFGLALFDFPQASSSCCGRQRRRSTTDISGNKVIDIARGRILRGLRDEPPFRRGELALEAVQQAIEHGTFTVVELLAALRLKNFRRIATQKTRQTQASPPSIPLPPPSRFDECPQALALGLSYFTCNVRQIRHCPLGREKWKGQRPHKSFSLLLE
jgi:hypothetical protein